MKHLFLLPTFLLLNYTILFSQGCLPEGITFSTQEEIDNFQINYPGCTEIEGDVIIGNLYGSNISNLNGLSSLILIGGYLTIIHNDELSSFQGLNNLTSAKSLIIDENNILTSLSGLNNLSSLNEALGIYGNLMLNDLSALSNLNQSIEFIEIINNDNLTNLSGLENINTSSLIELEIFGNLLLSECDIQNICDYIYNPGGVVLFFNNSSGCNNPEEVQQACLNSINENTTNDEITIFPNPATSFITIHIKEVIAIEEAIIYNHLGQKALEAMPVNNTVDVSGLKPGIYFIEVATKEWRGRTKLIIK
jgi:hypothetical protein